MGIPYRRPERVGRSAKRRQKTAPSFSHEDPYRGPCSSRLLFHVTSENSLTRLRGGGSPQGGYILIGAVSHINIFSLERGTFKHLQYRTNYYTELYLQDRTFSLIYIFTTACNAFPPMLIPNVVDPDSVGSAYFWRIRIWIGTQGQTICIHFNHEM